MREKVVSSSEEEGLVELEAADSRSKRQRTVKHDGSAAAVQWERFLPKMVLRVLLVEADDSTRQIISALLRKCRYKVLAVPDGLKAWEILKLKPHSIDIVLTEVELPSISGFSLLTLVMEHDVCRNIPIIMMSSHDSISTVLKCMLKGAADFLIKPVRKNELRILWQHVWRRHTGLVQPKCNNASYLSNCDTEKHEEYTKLTKELVKRGSETEERSSKFGTEVAPCNEADNSIACAKGTAENTWNGNKKSEVNCSSDEPLSRAIDLIGTFDYNRALCSHVHSSSVNSGSNRAECAPQLELSLTRFRPSSLKDDESSERCALNHSNASAFSLYNNTKTSQPLFTAQAGNITNLEEGADKTCYLSSNHCTENTVATLAQQGSTLDNNGITLIHGQSGQTERVFPRSQFGPVSVPGLRYIGCFHVLPSLLYTKSDMLSASSPKPACQLEQSPSTKSLKQVCDETLNNQTDNGENNLEAREVSRYDSSSLCNGVATERRSSVHGSTCSRSDRVTMAVTEKANATESSHDVGRSSLREAALAKFRLKRKERWYEKKVRYQSRRRLAVQRPSLKGQFVRQEQTPGAGDDPMEL